MEIPLTISRSRHSRSRDKEPGIRKGKFPKKQRFLVLDGVPRFQRENPELWEGRGPAAREVWDPGIFGKHRNGFREIGISLPRKAALHGNQEAGNVGSWNVV